MDGPYVDQVMSRPVETVPPSTPVDEAAATLVERDVGALVVVDEANRIEGILTATDYVLQVRNGGASPGSTVAEVAHTDVVTTERSALVSEVADAMLEHRIHHVPVVEADEVVGMVTALDLAAYLARSL